MNKEIKTRDGTVFFIMNCMNEEEYRKKKNENKVHRIALGLLYVVFSIVVLMTYCAFPELLQYKKWIVSINVEMTCSPGCAMEK